MKVTSIRFKEVMFSDDVRGYRFADFLNDKMLYDNYYSGCCLRYHPEMRQMYYGMTAFNGDVLYAYDPATSEFKSCRFGRIADRYDVKVHHSIELDDDGSIFGAVGGLHGLDEYLKAPGGCIFRYDPRSDNIEKLGIPVPHEYIQAITLDRKRRLIYGVTYEATRLFCFDLNSGVTKDLGPLNCYPETLALGRDGSLCTNWMDEQRKLHVLRYTPDNGKTDYFYSQIPSTPVVSPYYKKTYDNEIDSIFTASDGCVYFGTEIGMLYRLEPDNQRMRYLGKPLTELRLPGLTEGPDGLIYGVGGDNDQVELFSFNPKTMQLKTLGRITDPRSGDVCFRPHDVCVMPDGKTVYVAETDTPKRTAYLWRCEL